MLTISTVSTYPRRPSPRRSSTGALRRLVRVRHAGREVGRHTVQRPLEAPGCHVVSLRQPGGCITPAEALERASALDAAHNAEVLRAYGR